MVIRCKVDSIDYLNHDTRRVLLRVPEGETVTFNAGQYLEIILSDRRCPFSIASKPAQDELIELHVRPTPDSEDSKLIESFLDTAEYIDIQLPLGDCFLDTPPEGPLLLIAAGTGVTQMKSIIDYLIPMDTSHPIYLYWGVVSESDLYLFEQYQLWSQTHQHFHFVPVVSEPDSSPDWGGETGLVGQIALKNLMAEQDKAKLAALTVYISGSPGMVYATSDMLVAEGLPLENINSDMFSYAPRVK